MLNFAGKHLASARDGDLGSRFSNMESCNLPRKVYQEIHND